MTVDVNALWTDVKARNKRFLPGPIPEKREFVARLTRGKVLFDGLTDVERALILSTLPAGPHAIYVQPLDKGLSGAKVLAARYETNAGLSRRFVLKLGSTEKVLREAEAVDDLVAPHLVNYGLSVTRACGGRAILAQGFLGGDGQPLRSLREVLPTAETPSRLIAEIFQCLEPFHRDRGTSMTVAVKQLFRWHLSKRGHGPVMPAGWEQLGVWVAQETGFEMPTDADQVARALLGRQVRTPTTISHGDLHSQNVIVRGAACWPIDFAWAARDSSPLVDLTMLECSLKFFVMPPWASRRALVQIERALLGEPSGDVEIPDGIPYRHEIENVLKGVAAIRAIAMDQMGFSFPDYRAALFALTYALSTREGLNLPLVVSSLQLQLASAVGEET